METSLDKLNSNGRKLHNMLLEVHSVQSLTSTQIQRILSFQNRISSVDLNNGPSRDTYPQRFKIEGKAKHGGYLDTRKFWKLTSTDPVGFGQRGYIKVEQVIAQA